MYMYLSLSFKNQQIKYIHFLTNYSIVFYNFHIFSYSSMYHLGVGGIMVTPNRKLEMARLKKRWSVETACKKIGVSVNTFNRWERGLQLPQLETLDQLCEAFGMSPEELGFGDIIAAKRR